MTLTLNGEVLDENSVTSTSALGNLRDNPGIPQLINDRFLVADQFGRVRIIPEPGEDPSIAANFTTDMLAQRVAPSAPAAATSSPNAPVVQARERAASLRKPPTSTGAAAPVGTRQAAFRTLSDGSTLLDPIIVDSQKDRELRQRQEVKRLEEKAEAERRKLELLLLPPTLKDENGEPLARFEGDLVVIPDKGIFSKTPNGELMEIDSPQQVILRDPRDGKRKVFRQTPISDSNNPPFVENGQVKFQPVSETEGNVLSRFITDVRRASGPRFIENAQNVDLAAVVIEGIKTGIQLRNPALAPFLILINLSGELIVEPSIEGALTVIRQRLSDAGFSESASNRLAEDAGQLLSKFV